jgi:hypothetical protein
LVVSGSAAGDARDFMVGAAVHDRVALQLGLDPAVLFDEAAAWAGPAGDLLQAFGRRQDVTLEALDGGKWRPSTDQDSSQRDTDHTLLGPVTALALCQPGVGSMVPVDTDCSPLPAPAVSGHYW